MKKITVSLDHEVYRRARRIAAARKTSVNQLVVDFLSSLTDDEELRAERRKRLEELFAVQDRGRQRKPVGRLKREEIYGRGLR